MKRPRAEGARAFSLESSASSVAEFVVATGLRPVPRKRRPTGPWLHLLQVVDLDQSDADDSILSSQDGRELSGWQGREDGVRVGLVATYLSAEH